MEAPGDNPVRIEPLSDARRREAITLVDRVFPSQGPLERLSLRLHRTRWAWLLGLAGVVEGRFWLAIRDDEVVGTVGLYGTRADAEEALWLGWYCVAPEARGARVGSALLAFAATEARRAGKRFLRLYTSTDPNEGAAQRVYERHGFRLVSVDRPLLWRPFRVARLRRELALAD